LYEYGINEFCQFNVTFESHDCINRSETTYDGDGNKVYVETPCSDKFARHVSIYSEERLDIDYWAEAAKQPFDDLLDDFVELDDFFEKIVEVPVEVIKIVEVLIGELCC
jgi:hypothetical protein